MTTPCSACTCPSLPGNPERKKYYLQAKELVEARRKGDEAADNAEKEIIKSKIADKLEKVATLSKLSAKEFVKQILVAYPPREVKVAKNTSASDELKAASWGYAGSRDHAETTPQDKLLYEEILMVINDKIAVEKSAT